MPYLVVWFKSADDSCYITTEGVPPMIMSELGAARASSGILSVPSKKYDVKHTPQGVLNLLEPWGYKLVGTGGCGDEAKRLGWFTLYKEPSHSDHASKEDHPDFNETSPEAALLGASASSGRKQRLCHWHPAVIMAYLHTQTRGEIILMAGNSHLDLAKLVADHLGIQLADVSVYHKHNRETMVEVECSIRGKDVYILQTGSKEINDTIMELLIMAYACKTASARRIIGIIPYMPYSKQSKMKRRGCIVSKLLAKMMCRAGFNQIITVDLHQKEIQGFFDCPVDNLRASPFLLQYVQELIPDYRNAVMVAPHPSKATKVASYAERLRLPIAVIHGAPTKGVDFDDEDGRNSPPPGSVMNSCEVPQLEGLLLRSPSRIGGRSRNTSDLLSIASEDEFKTRTTSTSVGIPSMVAKEKPPMNVVGDVGGKIAIIVDDIVDDLTSLVAGAELLKERGAYKIYILASHGIMSSDAPRAIETSPIDEVVVTNTVPHDLQKLQCQKIKTVDISILLAEAIRRIHYGESMSYLFRNIAILD
ncbi:unnamed protein product [Cyprideis torosa]|uniref:Ribose-phosphate pyrophosphokinase N-terminal domain-containing protein n=1 Tax=Cyprideis torosa TaxID=163714 RepID=A0A7R8WHI2_9CRUS|nr:unnamed protein product [Cyprideis torosa]CAG0894213.1 unnamed protein product [Cyprideis torosa]